MKYNAKTETKTLRKILAIKNEILVLIIEMIMIR